MQLVVHVQYLEMYCPQRGAHKQQVVRERDDVVSLRAAARGARHLAGQQLHVRGVERTRRRLRCRVSTPPLYVLCELFRRERLMFRRAVNALQYV